MGYCRQANSKSHLWHSYESVCPRTHEPRMCERTCLKIRYRRHRDKLHKEAVWPRRGEGTGGEKRGDRALVPGLSLTTRAVRWDVPGCRALQVSGFWTWWDHLRQGQDPAFRASYVTCCPLVGLTHILGPKSLNFWVFCRAWGFTAGDCAGVSREECCPTRTLCTGSVGI